VPDFVPFEAHSSALWTPSDAVKNTLLPKLAKSRGLLLGVCGLPQPATDAADVRAADGPSILLPAVADAAPATTPPRVAASAVGRAAPVNVTAAAVAAAAADPAVRRARRRSAF
jgi:hypothetical protein